MRPRGMTDEAMRQAQEEARGEAPGLRRKPEVEAQHARLRAKVEAIKAAWIRAANDGDKAARALLREVYPEEFAELDAAAAVLSRPVPRPWTETDREEDA